MTAARRHGAAGHRWERFAEYVREAYGDQCWLCGHWGARHVDHAISLTERPDLAFNLANCRIAHGSPGNACPTCSKAAGRPIFCNQLRGGYSAERARRRIAELTGLPPREERRPRRDPGREW